MNPRITLASALFAFALPFAAACKPAPAAEPDKPYACQIGDRVVDRQNRQGTVTKAKGADCTVKRDDGSEGFYLGWMLTNATGKSAPAASATGLTKGAYRCSAAGGLAGSLKLVVKDATTYADRNGKEGTYAFDATTSRIVFSAGPWKGQFGKKLGAAKIGVSSRPGGFFGTTCDLEK